MQYRGGLPVYFDLFSRAPFTPRAARSASQGDLVPLFRDPVPLTRDLVPLFQGGRRPAHGGLACPSVQVAPVVARCDPAGNHGKSGNRGK